MNKTRFNSDNFIFRATPMALALVKAGLAKEPDHLIREPKREGILRQRNDDFNTEPSAHVVLNAPEKETRPAIAGR